MCDLFLYQVPVKVFKNDCTRLLISDDSWTKMTTVDCFFDSFLSINPLL
jgi:hypothetical protein